jgi:two-component system chemotaxis response regulator CheB
LLRVLVVDDSAASREHLSQLLVQDPALRVAGAAADGAQAVELARRLRPDVIVMDVFMPKVGGYEATRRIMEEVPTPIVMVSASLSAAEVTAGIDAVRAGALTIMEKPHGGDHPAAAEEARQLIETVKLMAEVRVVRRWPQTAERPKLLSLPPRRPGGEIRVVAIGSSTGGPQVLAEVLSRLPAELPLPVAVVQHLAPGFLDGLRQWLASSTRLTVKLAEHAEMARDGHVYLAPDGYHLRVTGFGRLQLSPRGSADAFCPSVTVLFDSVTESYGPAAIGVLLTGMGRDGASGLRRMREAGAITVAQDEETSAIFGMPAAAIALDAATHVLPPIHIAELICAAAAGAG